MNFKHIFKKLSGAVLFNGLGSLFGILSTIIISRYYGSELLGTISFSLQFLQILMVISLFGFRQQIIKTIGIGHANKDYVESSELVNSARLISSLFSLIFTLIVIFSIDYLTNNIIEDENLASFLSVFIWALIFVVVTKTNSFTLIGLGQFKKSVLYDGFYNTFFVFLMLVICVVGNIKVTGTFIGFVYLASRILNFIISEINYRKNPNLRVKAKIDFSLLKQGRTYFVISVINTLVANIDLLIIGYYCTPSEIAIYAVCSRLAKVTKLISYVISSAVSPDIASKFHNNQLLILKNLLRKYLFFTLIISSCFLILIFFFGENILSLWGNEYSVRSEVLLIMVAGTAIGFIFSPYENLLTMTGSQGIELKINTIGAFIYIATLFYLTAKFGIMGSAIAFFINFALLSISRYLISLNKLHLKNDN